MHTRQNGFSLLEMAIVLVIIGTLAGMLISSITIQQELQRIRETQVRLNEIKESLLGFAIVNNRLPCPAISATNGTENLDNTSGNITYGRCVGDVYTGWVPWATLNVPKGDAWQHLFSYKVTPEFTYHPQPDGINGSAESYFSLTTTGSYTIKTRDLDTSSTLEDMAKNVPAVVISYGKNGNGATTLSGGVASAPSNADEITNATASAMNVLSRDSSNEFDDIVMWLSSHVLFNRMVMAQRLP